MRTNFVRLVKVAAITAAGAGSVLAPVLLLAHTTVGGSGSKPAHAASDSALAVLRASAPPRPTRATPAVLVTAVVVHRGGRPAPVRFHRHARAHPKATAHAALTAGAAHTAPSVIHSHPSAPTRRKPTAPPPATTTTP